MRLHKYDILAVALLALIGLMLPETVVAQHHKERGLVRDGNEQFAERNYRRSLNLYNAALDHDSTSYEALYNRANAYYQAFSNNRGDSTYTAATANAYFEQIAADTLLSHKQRAEAYRNLGESLFSEEQYEAALNSFRESLKLNPADKETKYNYVLTKRIVDQKRKSQQNQNNQQNQDNQNNQQNQQNQDNQDNQQNQQNQDNQNNQHNQQNQDNEQNDQNKDSQDKQNNNQNNDNNEDGDQNQDNGNGDQNKDGSGDQNKDGNNGAEPEPRELSPDKRRMLDAIQAEEDKTQERMKEGEKALVVRGKKNW